MKLLIRSAQIVDPASPHNGKQKDILITNGKITKIGSRIPIPKNAKVLDKGNFISPGWFDLFSCFNDPGFEQKEDIHSGIAAAAAGGFTAVACMPNTFPAIDSKAGVEYIINKSKGQLVDVHPVGAISQELKGEVITEIYDMKEAGAIAFTNVFQHGDNAGLMQRALQYVRPFDGVIMGHPEDTSISLDGQMNEGVISTQLGFKGMPALSEEVVVMRDIYLAEYTGSRLHFLNVSTKRSVELIKEAKKKGLKVTASVTPFHLLLTEEDMLAYDSNYKVNPPLRTAEDVKALRKGLVDGTIDAVCSQHEPQDEESKKKEFEYAAYGMIGLETAFSLICMGLGKQVNMDLAVDKLALQPRNIIGMPIPPIAEGTNANLTIFDPEATWTYTTDHIHSKSHNSPFIGREMQGKVVGTVNNGHVHLNA